jgi:hypothetical protein
MEKIGARVYRSKADAWLVTALCLAIAGSLGAAYAMLSSASMSATPLAMAAVSISIGSGLPAWLLLSTRYTLEARQLVVQSGPFCWRIDYAEIEAITPTSNPSSSPALSLDRLRIDYGRGKMLMISPRDRSNFLLAIEAKRHGAT